MTSAATALSRLKDQRPEWKPWVAVVEEVLRDGAGMSWESAVPTTIHTEQATVPLLAGTTIVLQAGAVRRLLERVILVASRSGTPRMATLERILSADLDVLKVFAASLCQRSDDVTEIARASGADAAALQAVVALVALPFLQACNRKWGASVSQSWVEGHCPVCGAWPTLAEVRGIERSRCFRCGRCGSDWYAQALYCPYCGTSDHHDLLSLVPEKAGSRAVIDACKRCLGYVKTLTTLQGCPPGAVMLEDLATVDLDVAALEQGYARPAGAGCSLDVTVVDAGAERRFSAGNK